jgi:beta-phosphoglucomutase-like phosphatase (HAD superfamily)
MHYCDTVVGGGDVQKHKPDPEPYRLAASRVGVTRAVAPEDSGASRRAGQRVRGAADRASERGAGGAGGGDFGRSARRGVCEPLIPLAW